MKPQSSATRGLSLRGQVTAIVGLTTAGVLVAAAGLLFWGEQTRHVEQVTAMLQAEAHLVGSNSIPALEFDDSAAGEQILGSLRATPEVVSAVLRKTNGEAFAHYRRANGAATEANGVDSTALRVGRPISSAQGPVGSIEIVADRDVLYQGLWQRVLNILGTVVLALAVALVAAFRGASRVIRPVSQLVAVAGEVAGHHDYSLRAQVRASGEIAQLVEAFNAMLGGIETRDRALVAAKARVESTSRELADASRRAGMAEVTAGVLHNVGNALNSVTVSASHLRTTVVEASKLPQLNQALAMLGDNLQVQAPSTDELERRHLLLEYLNEVIHHLERTEASVADELSALERKIEHIRAVIGYHHHPSRTSTVVVEEVVLEDVVEMALALGEANGRSRDIEIVRRFAPVGAFPTDRHKVIQIVLNLISNARHALAAAEACPKQIIVTTRRGEEGFVEIEVRDNGVGIDPAIRDRLFRHGFTTRGSTNGKGFGLHSSANLAGELGGSLEADSAGPGCGAVFTLTLAAQSSRETPAPSATSNQAEPNATARAS